MSAELIINAATGTDLEIDAALKTLRNEQVARIQTADREIPILCAEVQAIEERIALYRVDRKWCVESRNYLERRIAEMEES